jgi:hypothetical protein
MRVDEVEARCRPPVAEKPRLDVLQFQRQLQERVVEQIDLTDREIVGGTPPCVDEFQLRLGRR